MKGKIFSVLFALVLVLSLSLVMAAPAAASAVGTPTVALSTYLASAADVQYTISFDLGASLPIGGSITIDFDNAYVSPATVANNEVTIDGVGILGAAVDITTATDTWVITLATAISTSTNPVVVVITSAANLPNPVVGSSYTVSVTTSAETEGTSAAYAIIDMPTVTGVEPVKGNVGDTMWVEVTGTTFTGTTTACTTTFNFGAGISVVPGSYHWVSATSVDCQITIASAGAVSVAATTPAGTGITTGTFTANTANTAQVDVWLDYTPDADILADAWDATTLVPRATTMSYATITLAEAAATDSDTIIVHPGTYNEKNLKPGDDVDVTIQSLTGLLTGTGSAADTIISPSDLAAGSGEYVLAMATGTGTADALTVKGLTISSSTAFVGGLPAGGVGIRIHGTADAAGVLTVTNCNISNFLWGVATEQATSSTISVSGCTLSSNNHGIALWQAAALTLTGSTLTDNFGDGVLVEVDNTGQNILIYKNTFQDNNSTLLAAGDPLWPASGIAFTATTGKMLATWSVTNAISYNNFINNGFGIENRGGEAVPARYNWWGDISGPSAGDVGGTTALGSGDAILDADTVFDPWLTETYANTYVDNIRYYGSLMPLEAGWNTLSVPCGLKDSANTFGEIASLGSYIVSTGATANYLGGYYFDAATSTWAQIYSDTAIVPGQGFYVKMSAVSTFPVLYSGQIGLPSVSLPAGWNLVGSMFGIDKTVVGTQLVDYGITTYTDANTDSWKTVANALVSIAGGASVILSPSLPGQTAAWGTTITGADKMIVGEGYWVFMTAAGTLAGYEVTPMYFVFP